MTTTTLSPLRPKLFRGAIAAAALAVAAVTLSTMSTPQAIESPPQSTFVGASFADVIERAQPAVVKIDVKKVVAGVARLDGREMPFAGSPFEQFMRRFGAGPVPFDSRGQPPAEAEGLGSGFIIDSDGYVVTNNHVVDGAKEMKVTLHDGRTFPATMIGRDEMTDLALLKIDGSETLPSIRFGDSEHARVGDWVVAIGSPFGLGGSVTAGIISARGRDIRSGPYDDYLQIDAPINSGNSGGPIIDANGEVIGVNTAIYSPNGGNIGIGFAIPAAAAERIVAELKDKGTVTRGWLGVQIQQVTADVASALELDGARGALVAAVQGNSPAALAGMQVGDVVVRFNGEAIETPRDLSRAVARVGPGAQVAIAVVRNGRERHLSAVVERNAGVGVALAPDRTTATDDALGLGLALGELSSDARQRMQLEDSAQGALVVGIKSGGVADGSGLQPGDVIVRVNQKAVVDVHSAERALGAAAQSERPFVLLVRRGPEQFFMTMQAA